MEKTWFPADFPVNQSRAYGWMLLIFFMLFLRVALRLLQDIYILQEILHFAPHQAPRGVTLPPCRYIRDETMIAI
jgi:hypothetical protein